MAKLLPLSLPFLVLASCGGRVEDSPPADVGTDANVASDSGGPDAALVDAHPRGEYPPEGTDDCFAAFGSPTDPCPGASCDSKTGWCCNGWLVEGRCECGSGGGCAKGDKCCPVPGGIDWDCRPNTTSCTP